MTFLKTLWGFLCREWAYFRRGYMIYISFGLGLINFLTIQYNFLVLEAASLRAVFSDIVSFGVVFSIICYVVARTLGWVDMRKGVMATEQSVNPYIIDTVKYNGLIADALNLISQGRHPEAQVKLGEARRIMERWGAGSTSS